LIAYLPAINATTKFLSKNILDHGHYFEQNERLHCVRDADIAGIFYIVFSDYINYLIVSPNLRN